MAGLVAGTPTRTTALAAPPAETGAGSQTVDGGPQVPERKARRSQNRRTSSGGSSSKRSSSRGAGSDPGWTPAVLLTGPPLLGTLVLLYLSQRLFRGVPDRPLVGPILLAVVVTALLVLLLAVRRVLTATEPTLVGAPLSAQQEPRVWRTIEEIAGRLGAPAPQHVVVDGSPMVAVSRVSGSRNMVIGLPLLLELEPAQFGAVLARELALSTSGGLPVASRIRRLGERLDAALDGRPGDPVGWLLIRYRQLYRGLAGDCERLVEERADDQAAELLGPQQVAEALQRLMVIQLGWQTLVEEYLPLSEEAGMRPLLAEGLHEILTHRGPDLWSAANPGRPGAPAAQPGPSVTGPADTGMLDDPATLSRIESAILLDDDPHGGWPEIADAAGRREIGHRADRFVAQTVTDPDQATLAGVLRRLDQPGRATPAGGLASPLTALVQDAMLHAGLAGFALNWTGPSRLRRRDPSGVWVDWDGDLAITAAAHSPAGVDQLRSWLFAAGADFDRRYELPTPGPTPDSAPAPDSAPVSDSAPASDSAPDLEVQLGQADTRTDITGASDVELLGPYPVDTVDLLVYRNGLLLRPVPAPSLQDRSRALVGRAPGAQHRLAELAETTGDHPEQQRGGWWIELGDFTSSSLRERRSGFELQLRKDDGSATTLRQRPTSALRGDPVGDLRLRLPGS